MPEELTESAPPNVGVMPSEEGPLVLTLNTESHLGLKDPDPKMGIVIRKAGSAIGEAPRHARYPSMADLEKITWAAIEPAWSEQEKKVLLGNPHLMTVQPKS